MILNCSPISSEAVAVQSTSTTRVEHKELIWSSTLSHNVLKLARTPDCFAAMAADPKIQLELPRKDALTGTVLKHACSRVEKMLQTHGPAVFKFGYTHDPTWRFRNRHYGYVQEVQKWQQMTVLYTSHECVGPAFLEASLFHKFKGYFSAFSSNTLYVLFVFHLTPVILIWVPVRIEPSPLFWMAPEEFKDAAMNVMAENQWRVIKMVLFSHIWFSNPSKDPAMHICNSESAVVVVFSPNYCMCKVQSSIHEQHRPIWCENGTTCYFSHLDSVHESMVGTFDLNLFTFPSLPQPRLRKKIEAAKASAKKPSPNCI